MAFGTEWVGRALAAWVALVLRYRRLTIVFGLTLGAACLNYAAGNLGINTDTADMISPELPWRQDFIEYRETFGARHRNVLIVVDAESAESADAFAARLADGLRDRSELYHDVFLAGEGEFFERNGLLYLSSAELERLADRLAAAQPLLGRLARRFQGSTLVDTLDEALERDAPAHAALEIEPFLSEMRRSVEAAGRGERYAMSWQKIIQAERGAAARRYLLVQPVQDFTRTQPAREAIEQIRALSETLRGAQRGEVEVRLTGTVAMEHEELISVSRGAGVAGFAALAMVALVLYLTLRSGALLVISVATLIVGLSCTAAFAAATVGHLNLLSVAFAVLYVGLGVDFIIHILLRLRELLAGGAAMETAIVTTVRGVGSSLAICAITTAAGFYSFIPTPFKGVSELGLISGTGMFISLIVSVTLLPALTAQFLSPTAHAPPSYWLVSRVLAPLTRHPRRVLTGAVLVAGAALAALPRVSFDNNPVHLRDPNTESVTTLRELMAAGEAIPMHLVAVARNSELAGQWKDALETLPTVRRVSTIDSLVPANQDDKQRLLEDIAILMGPGFADLEPGRDNPRAFRGALERLHDTLAGRSAADAPSARLAQTIDAFVSRLDGLPEPERSQALLDLEADLLASLPGRLQRLQAGLQAQPFDRSALPGTLRARWIGPEQQELLEIAPAEDLDDNESAARFVESVRSLVANATGLPVVHLEASRTVIHSFQRAFSYALVTVGVLLWVFLSGSKDSLLVLFPVVLASGVTAGIAALFGIEFNFANIIALPLLLGVGVDNGIHMVHRVRTEPPADRDVINTSTSKAVLASGLTTVASFGNLAFSSHLGMASMGRLLTLGMAVTLVATLIVLPALLELRARR